MFFGTRCRNISCEVLYRNDVCPSVCLLRCVKTKKRRSSFNIVLVFTARCTLLQSAVLRSHVVCLSVCPSVTLEDCDHIGWNFSKLISPLVSLWCSLFATPTSRVCSKGNTPKFGPKVTHPLVIWASETFDCILRLNGYRYRNCHNGEPIRNHHRSFEWCHCWPPTTSPSSKMGFHMPPRYANGHISATRDPITSCLVLG